MTRPTHDPATVVDTLAGLPPRQRRAVLLAYFRSMPVEKVADELSAGVPTVHADLHRAVRALLDGVATASSGKGH
ncbi:MAG TPA: sigma factor-like helix-turn-helix DNA-binding protein [Aldersonia sp.]